MLSLDEARTEINAVDREMAALFERRMKAVESVISYKMKNGLPIFDEAREKQIVEHNSGLIENEQLLPFYREFLIMMMEISKKYQQSILDRTQALV